MAAETFALLGGPLFLLLAATGGGFTVKGEHRLRQQGLGPEEYQWGDFSGKSSEGDRSRRIRDLWFLAILQFA
jgi:hypothetical protein